MNQLRLLDEVAAQRVEPFLRWAGAKRLLAPTILRFVPTRFNEYIEPFVGGGSIFFALRPSVALLSDANPELMNSYRAVRDNVDGVIARLREFELMDSDNFYTDLRGQSLDGLGELERAARFIYFNRTCYNGLYRLNKAGLFNVPRGMTKPAPIVQVQRLQGASIALQAAVLETASFEIAMAHAQPGDFVYLDPPYVPPDPNARAFTEYTRLGFSLDDHIRLANWFERLTDAGVFALMSNSLVDEVRDLYPETRYEYRVLTTRRQVASKPSSRLPIEEALIANYPIDSLSPR